MAGIQTGIELNDQFTMVLNSIVSSVNLAISGMYEMQQSMSADIDTSSIEGARDEINQATMAIQAMNEALGNQAASAAMPSQANAPPEPVEIPVQWQSDTMDVFTNAGMERFEQEVQSTNDLLNTLNQTQQQIAETAARTDLFPAGAVSDMNSIQSRLQAIQQRIQTIEGNSLNMGTDTANAELERLRGQLNQAVQEQNELNQAMQNMDVSAANAAYLRLSQMVSRTEQYIRDNVDEQGRFNSEIQEGTQNANGLVDMIKGAIAAYTTIQTLGKAVELSDELTQTRARLDLMNDGAQTTDELFNMIYASAQNARGSLQEMADVVARFGNNAGDAFSSTEEVVGFAELVQKQMTIAGASTQEASNAMLQLSQALGSGVLRGDELNSIFEQAPNLIRNIADYLGVGIGEIREMASEGEITADIVKAAMFSAADEINADFEAMPMTWSQIWQSFQNDAIMAFQPVLQRMNEIANSEAFQEFANGAVEVLSVVAGIAIEIFNLLINSANVVADNWSWLSPIIYGVAGALAVYYGAQLTANAVGAISKGVHFAMAAAQIIHAAATGTLTAATAAGIAAQNGLNASLYACPIVWIIILIIALIAIIYAVCAAIAKFTGIAGSGFGVICGYLNVVIQGWKNLGLTIANIALGIASAVAALGSNIMTAFHNAICSVQSWWYDLLSTCLSVIESICVALNKLPFVEFDYSGISNAADDYAAKSAEAAGNKEEYQSIGDAFSEGYNTFDTFQDGWISDAFNSGAAWGDGVADKVSGALGDFFGGIGTDIPNPDDYTYAFDNSAVGSGIGDIAENTGDIADSMDITEEDLKYLRDIAEQETVNRFTTAEITIEQTNHNNVSGKMDLDGVVDGLTDAVNEAVDIIAEGVHV